VRCRRIRGQRRRAALKTRRTVPNTPRPQPRVVACEGEKSRIKSALPRLTKKRFRILYAVEPHLLSVADARGSHAVDYERWRHANGGLPCIRIRERHRARADGRDAEVYARDPAALPVPSTDAMLGSLEDHANPALGSGSVSPAGPSRNANANIESRLVKAAGDTVRRKSVRKSDQDLDVLALVGGHGAERRPPPKRRRRWSIGRNA
jgi:hypothetical protein